MTKIINLSLDPYFKLLYMSWNFYRKIFNILIQNLMWMEHFEICILKLIKKLISWKLIDQIELILYSLYFMV